MLRPRLSLAEFRFLVSALCTSVSLALTEVSSITSHSSALTVINFDGCFSIIQLICYLVVMFATTVNLQLIASTLADGPMTYTAAILYHKQQAYINFRKLFMLLVFRPSILLSLQILIPTEIEWVIELLRQASILLIYVAFFSILCPSKHHVLDLLRPQTSAEHLVLSYTPSHSESEEEDATVPRTVTAAPGVVGEEAAAWHIEEGDLAAPGGLLAGIATVPEVVISSDEEAGTHYVPLAGDSD